MVASAGSCFTDQPNSAASPQASHWAMPGPRSLVLGRGKSMTKPQERQALYPRPEVSGLYGPVGKLYKFDKTASIIFAS